ncbi:diacylglycerol kinase family protein [Cryomorphaceae bacterium 1068]|nr:diacylglycerol kinase family protein [Cryomorphaceae bacterium 1068]
MKKRLHSFKYAFEGFRTLLKEEPNSRIHLVAAAIAIAAGFFFGITQSEWIALLFAIGFVFAMELLNSAIENLSDLVSPEKNSFIKKAKDQAAAAVLISAIVSFGIGLIIFIPKIILLMEVMS